MDRGGTSAAVGTEERQEPFSTDRVDAGGWQGPGRAWGPSPWHISPQRDRQAWHPWLAKARARMGFDGCDVTGKADLE